MRTLPARADCSVCGRRRVAIMRSGRLWPHKVPGVNLWTDGGDCKGPVVIPPGARWRMELEDA